MKPRFAHRLECTPLADGRNWRLTDELLFTDAAGDLHIIPKGFVTDFASIPPLGRIGLAIQFIGLGLQFVHPAGWLVNLIGAWLVWLAPELNGDDSLDAPAVVHDWYYRAGKTSRMMADAWLYQGMIAVKVPAWKRWVVYCAVRLFGGSAWKGRQS